MTDPHPPATQKEIEMSEKPTQSERESDHIVLCEACPYGGADIQPVGRVYLNNLRAELSVQTVVPDTPLKCPRRHDMSWLGSVYWLCSRCKAIFVQTKKPHYTVRDGRLIEKRFA